MSIYHNAPLCRTILQGGVPLGWIFGSGNSQGKADQGTNSLADYGKNAHFPEMLEDNDVIEDAADSAVSGSSVSTVKDATSEASSIAPKETSNVAGENSVYNGTVTTKADAATDNKRTTQSWYDWITWK